MVHGRCNCCFSFWAIFCPFTSPPLPPPPPPLPPQNMKISKKRKEQLEVPSFYTGVPIIITCYTVPEIRHMKNVIAVFHFGQYLLPFYPTNSPKNKKFLKNETKAWRHHHFTLLYQKL